MSGPAVSQTWVALAGVTAVDPRSVAPAGATLVVGNHPHLIQPLEEFRAPDGTLQGLTAYALGNFVFDQQAWRTRQGLVLETDFVGHQLVAWRIRPTHIYSFYAVQWAEGEEAQAILDRVAALNARLPER